MLPWTRGSSAGPTRSRRFSQGRSRELTKPPARKKDEQVTWDVLSAVRRLPALPAVGPERLVKLAGDQRPAVQETAVRASAGSTPGRASSNCSTPSATHARWAVYAMRQALNDLPPKRVLEVMARCRSRRSRWQRRRCGWPANSAGLKRSAGSENFTAGTSIGTSAPLLRVWDHLDRPEAWAILDASVASPDPGVVIGLARIQVDRASDEARDRVANLLRRLLDHPEPTVRVAVLNRLSAQPVPDPKRELLSAILAKLASTIPDERTAGLSAALAGATDADAPAFAAAFMELLPRRRELAASVTSFAVATRALGTRLREVRSAVLATLEADPAVLSLQIRLAAALFAPEAFARWVLGLVDTGRWHAPTQVAAFDALCESGRLLGELERAEAVWAPSPDPAGALAALRILTRTASTWGWSDDRRELPPALSGRPKPARCRRGRTDVPAGAEISCAPRRTEAWGRWLNSLSAYLLLDDLTAPTVFFSGISAHHSLVTLGC